MSDPVKPKGNGNVPTTTIDFDLDLTPVSLDPRNQMAERLLFRGHATLSEILAVSFGEWPPKGLNVMGGNQQRVDFVSLSKMFNTTDEKVLLEKGRDALGFADAGQQRQVWISDKARGSGSGANMLASILGHEGAHILQFDHQSRAPSAFGGTLGNRLAQSYSKPISGLIADSVFGRHTDEKRQSVAAKPFEGKTFGLDYYKDGVEIQARIHEVMIEGYPKWGRLPQNREQFLVAMESAGLILSGPTMSELKASPNYEEAKRVFGTPARTRAADEINIARSTLTANGKFSFENDALPRMYADLIEMYGDREGRARFGYGVNEFARAHEARANINPNGVRDIPDFKPIMGENGMFIPEKDMDKRAYAKVQEEFKRSGIKFSESVSGQHGKGMQVGIEEFVKIGAQRILAREPVITLPEPDRTLLSPERVLAQIEIQKTNKGTHSIPIGRKPEADQKLLIETLDKEGIKYKQTQPAYNGGVLTLEIEPQNVAKLKALHAEAQLDRPVFLDPKKPEYQAQIQQAQNQRQLHDFNNPDARQAAMRAVLPPSTPTQQRAMLARSELIETVGKGDYISVEGKSLQDKKILTDALDAAKIKYTEKRSSIDGSKQVLAIDPAATEKIRALHESVSTDRYGLAQKPLSLADEAHMAVAGQRARAELADASHKPTRETQMRTLGGSEIIHTANKGDYISLEGRSPQDKKILMETLDKAGIKYAERTSSLDGGKQVLAIDASGTEKFRTLHADSVKVAAIPPGAAAAAVAEAVSLTGRASQVAGAMPNVGSGVGIAMGVYGLSQKLGENGTAAKDLKDERTATLAKVGIAADTAAIAADSTELLVRASRSMATAAKVGRVAAPVGVALSVASGAIDYKIAEKQGDGKRAAAAIGSTTGGIAGAMAGGIAGAKVGAAVGAAVGVWFGGVGAGPGALIGSAVFGVAGAMGFGWAGAEGGKKVAEATIEKPLQKKFDEDKKAQVAAAAAKPASPASPAPAPAAAPTATASVTAPKTQAAANQPAYNEPSSKYAQRLDAPSTERFAASAPALGKEFARASTETAVAAAPKPAVNDPAYKTAAVKPVAIPVV
jgi:hypothetical protein